MEDEGSGAPKIELVPVATDVVLQATEPTDSAPQSVPSSKSSIAARRDFEVVFASILISLGIFGLFTASESRLWTVMTSTVHGKKVADLASMHNGVRYRPAESLVWHDVGKKDQALYDSDVVFTDENGSAEITLDQDAVVVEVDPNSLLVIKMQNGAALEVGKGSIRVRFSKKPTNIKVKSQGKTYKVSSEKEQVLQISGAEDESAPLLFIGESVQVHDDFGSKVDVVQKRIELVSPQSGESVVLVQAALATQFRWKRLQSSDVTGGKKMSLEIAGDAAQVIPLTGLEDSMEHVLRPGLYRWRIISSDSFGLKPESSWNHFSVSELLPPQLTGPVDGYTGIFEDGQTQQKQSLQWKKVSSEFKVEIEVGNAEKEADAKIQQATASGFSLQLPEGQFFWRVRTVDFQGRPSSWSETRRFALKQKQVTPPPTKLVESNQDATPATAPQPTSASPVVATNVEAPASATAATPIKPKEFDFKANDVQVTTSLKSSNTYEIPVLFQWEEVKGAQGYSVVVYNPQGKKVKDLKSEKNRLEHMVESLDQDGSTYQVFAHMGSAPDGFSNKAKIHVLISAPKPKLPEEGKEFSIGSSVLLTWEKIILAQNYRVQISERKDFKTTVVDHEKPGNIFTFSAERAGKYYWRVRGIVSKHQSEWSKPRSFVLK